MKPVVGHRRPDIRTMKMRVKRTQHADMTAAIVVALLAVFVVSCASTNPYATTNVTRESIRVHLPAGAADVESQRRARTRRPTSSQS